MRMRSGKHAMRAMCLIVASLAANAGVAMANDVACDAEVIGALPYVPVNANAVTATDDIDTGCNTTTATATRKGVWYRYNATSNTGLLVNETSGNDAAMAVFVGPDCNTLTEIHCSDDPDGIGFPVTAGQSYWILVGIWSTTGNPTTPYALTFSELASPVNDTACTAAAITSGMNSVVDARTAGRDAPPATCTSTANSAFGTRHAIWYSMASTPTGGLLNVNETSASGVVMQLFSGTSCNDLTVVNCTVTQNANFTLAANTNYWVSIGFNDLDNMPTATGSYNATFTFTPPPTNDVACSAEVFNSLPYAAVSVSGVTATDDVDNSCNATTNTNTRRGVWFRYDATSSGGVIANETSSNDTVMAVFTGPDCNSLTEVACNDSADGIGFQAVGGQSYWIIVGMWSASTVPTLPYALTFDSLAIPANDTCANAETIISGNAVSVDARTAGSDSPVATCAPAGTAFGNRHGVWYKFSTGADAGSMAFNETGSSSVLFQVFSGADCNTLTPEVCSTLQAGTLSLAANTTYWLNMSMNSADDMPSSTGQYAVTFTFTPVAGACCVGNACQILTGSACATAGGSFTGGSCTPPNGSNTTATNMPDFVLNTPPTVIELPITVSNSSGNVTSLSVTVDINHIWLGDVLLQLRAPDNTVVDLMGRINTAAVNCPIPGAIANGDDLVGVYTFIDSATENIRNYALNGPLVVIPSGPYQAATCDGTQVVLNTAFASSTANGTWTLLASDNDEAITGTINSWSITVNGGVPVNCGGGDPTPCELADFNDSGSVTADDIFAFLDAWFAQNGSTGPGFSADINDSDSVTADDIFAFLDLWFAQNGQSCN